MMKMCGFEQVGDKYIKYYGPYKITAGVTTKKSKGKTYRYFQCTIPVNVVRNLQKIEILSKNIAKPTLEELDCELNYIFRIDGNQPYYRAPELTVGEFAQQWFEDRKAGWTKSTRDTYKRWVDIIDDEIGAIKISQLSASQVDKFILGMMRKNNYRSGSVGQLKSVLSGIMRTAVLDGNAIRNPVKTRIPKSSTFEAVILQRSDLVAFHEATAQSKYYGAIEFQYATGVRISELIGLTWDELDFERGDIHINHQYQDGVLCDTKNKKRRTLKKHLHGRLLGILLEEKQRYIKMKQSDPMWNPLDLVFTGKHGNALTYSKLEQEITEIGAKIGLEHFTSHSLRHTYASHRAAVTGDLDLVQRELGHEHLITTLSYICQLEENVELHNQKMDYYWDSL